MADRETEKDDALDRLSRSISGARGRRDVLRLLGSGIAAAVGGVLVSRSTPAEADHLGLGPDPRVKCGCSHSVCQTGDSLFLCDDECAKKICLWDNYCCDPILGHWDETCVGYVATQCGQTCADDPPSEAALKAAQEERPRS